MPNAPDRNALRTSALKAAAVFARAGAFVVLFTGFYFANANGKPHPPDVHYTDAGFFDIHLCNWPDRAPFFKVLFSTFVPEDVKVITVRFPNGTQMISMTLEHYIEFTRDGRRKRVFLEEVDAPTQVPDGWYKAEILLNDGRIVSSADKIDTTKGLLPIAQDPEPADGADAIPLPLELSWTAVPGASHYQVSIRDLVERRLVYRSDLTSATHITVPDGKLEAGGWYQWLIHARDVNGDPELGDFNLGSQTSYFSFELK